jgi:HlyD family secretion protein
MKNGRWLLVSLWVVGSLGCGSESVPSSDGPAVSPTVAVTRPIRKVLRYPVEQPGRIAPFERTPIHARISGYVHSVNVEIGQRVKRGHLLAELDVPERVAEHERKQALVVEARLGITQAEQAEQVAVASLASARAQVVVARAAMGKATASLERWRSESKRMDGLVKDKVVDRQSGEEVLNQLRSAEAATKESVARITAAESALAEAQARREKASTDRAVARNQLLIAQAGEREAKALLDYCRITAPFDGVVADRQVDTGHFLQGENGDTKGKPLFVIVRMDKVRVFVEVPEADAVRVHHGNVGCISVQALNDREFVGKVAGTSWSLDPSQRTLLTEIDFENSDGLLRPGMYVHARIDVEHPEAWMIPAGAVLVRDGESFCYRVKEGRTQRLPLRPGLRDGDMVEVLKFQEPSQTPGALPRWVNPKGDEIIVVTKPAELIDNQPVELEVSAG